ICTGVIVITPTITTCPIAIADTPSRAAGSEATSRSASLIPARPAGLAASEPPNNSRATTAGSGRSKPRSSNAANPSSIAEKTKGPASVGTPYTPTVRPATGARLGPMIAPIVVAHTTSERWRPPNRGRCQVHGGVAGLQPGGSGPAEEEESQKQDRY